MTGPRSPLPWLPQTSTCATLIRALDWGRTPAGPIDRWPANLRTAVSVALNSGFPMGVLWGKERVQIYNDAYMPIFGRKHPASMGALARESWGELWTEIDPMFTAVEQTGRATFLVDRLLPMDKRGRVEECYFTFSYSPLFGDSGEVDGIFVSALETTRAVVTQRRQDLLQRLARAARAATSEREALVLGTQTLGSALADLPFCRVGLRGGSEPVRWIAGHDACGPTHQAPEGIPDSLLEDVLRDRIAREIGAGAPKAVVLPILNRRTGAALGVFVAGLSPLLPLEAEYRTFLQEVVEHLATACAGANAVERLVHERNDLLARMVDGYIHVGNDQRLTDANAGALEMLGVTLEQAVGRELMELIPARRGTDAHLQLLSVIETRQPARFETPSRIRSGVQLEFQIYPDEHGVSLFFRDVTARREAQANELRLTEILEATTDLVGTAAPDGTVLYVNRAGRAMLGLSADGPLPPANLLDFSPEEEGEGVRAAVDVARAEGTWSGERLLRRRGGEVFPVSQVILTHRNPEGEVSFFSTVARDITAQRRAEQTLRAAHALTSALIQTAPVAIITCDADLTVTGWNPAAERLFGWRADEVVGRPFPVESPDGDVLAELREEIAEGRTLQGREVHGLHRSGAPLDVLISTALIREPNGEISRRVAFILDVTERKRLEQQFLQAQKMEAVGQLAGGVAHDFNNLLAVISSNLQMALDELPRDTEVYEAVRDAHQGASRAISLTRQLLAFSRSQVLELEPLDLSAVVADAERMLRRLVREDIRFDTQLGQGLPPIRADRGQLEQVLVNLVVNARDAMPRGGNLTLRTARVDLEEGPFLELTVQDTGVGMGEHTRAHLFEPFFTTKPVGKGTGLGLATVYGIVRQLEGRIDVESCEGEGATFRVRIPIAEPDGSPPSPSRDCAPEAEVTGGEECILVVEDEPLVRSAIRRTLERYGYRVVEAEDGLDALEVHARERSQIALVLTDLVMPRLGGRALAERLEQAGARVPILFMSGYDREGAATAEAGTAVDVPKPFQTTALLRAIRQRLDG